jgi:hypothetical protein
MPVPGDVVRYDGEEKVVVDIADDDDPTAILRDRDDLTGESLIAAPADGLHVIGYIVDPA